MPTSEDVSALLNRLGLRPTKMRCLILQILLEKKIHPTPYQLLEMLNQQEGEEISIATLYQNLEKLVQEGLLKRFLDTKGLARFDINLDPHYHLVCLNCGNIADVEENNVLHKSLNPLKKQLPEDWQLNDISVEFKGFCPECRTS
ncbi:MAG: Fur family transcriptional regulator [Planctomycetota bacterium]